MNALLRNAPLVVALLVAGGCVSLPSGPSVLVLPGSRMNFAEFRTDDLACRQYAHEYIGGRSAEQRASDSGVSSAVVGTAVGAVVGAAVDGSRGAAIGAGTGLLIGSAAGSEAAHASSYQAQRRYDHAYVQCMYASGHRVPVTGQYSPGRNTRPDRTPPPPPPGTPPPPPPGAR